MIVTKAGSIHFDGDEVKLKDWAFDAEGQPYGTAREGLSDAAKCAIQYMLDATNSGLAVVDVRQADRSLMFDYVMTAR